MDLPKKILIIRNDKLGDFMLAYPTFNVVKKLFPDAIIYALIPEYTRPMAELCQWIDEIVIDDATGGLSGLIKTTSKLKSYNFDAALCLHSSPRIALSLFLAQIPHRFAPASRLDQIFYNHRLTQQRSRSEKPEFEYNIDLANFMGHFYSQQTVSPDIPPYLKFEDNELLIYKQEIQKKYRLDKNHKIVIVHAASGGSAINLSIEQYAVLISCLSENQALFFILTSGPGEENITEKLSALITKCNHSVYNSTRGLKDFSKLIAIANLFISGSTGVLHVAGALDVKTAAFYPHKISATSLRWKTLNSDDNHIAFTIDTVNTPAAQEHDLQQRIKKISKLLLV